MWKLNVMQSFTLISKVFFLPGDFKCRTLGDHHVIGRTLSLEEWRVSNLQVTVIKLPLTLINAVLNLAKELGHFPV